MTNKPFPTTISFAEDEGEFTGCFEGKAVLPWVGPSHAIIAGINDYEGYQAPHHYGWDMTFKLTDPDCSGLLVSGRKPVAGKDVSGRGNVRNVKEACYSSGLMTKEQINQLTATKQPFPVAEAKQYLIGRPCIIYIGAGAGEDGQQYSNMERFMDEEQYQEAVKNGLHRQPRPNVKPLSQRGGATAPVAGGFNFAGMGGAGAAPGAGAPPSALAPISAPRPGQPPPNPFAGAPQPPGVLGSAPAPAPANVFTQQQQSAPNGTQGAPGMPPVPVAPSPFTPPRIGQ